MPRISQKAYQDRKQTIIRKGIELVLDKGFNGVGVKEIAEKAGIPKGSFFNYFESKRDFALAAIEYTIEISIPYNEGFLQNPEKPPLDRIEAFYDANIRTLQLVMEFKRGCVLNQLTQELAVTDRGIAGRLKDSLSTLRKSLAETLREAQEAGEIGADHNVEELALFIDTSWRGAMILSRSLQDPSGLQAFKKYIFGHVLR